MQTTTTPPVYIRCSRIESSAPSNGPFLGESIESLLTTCLHTSDPKRALLQALHALTCASIATFSDKTPLFHPNTLVGIRHPSLALYLPDTEEPEYEVGTEKLPPSPTAHHHTVLLALKDASGDITWQVLHRITDLCPDLLIQIPSLLVRTLQIDDQLTLHIPQCPFGWEALQPSTPVNADWVVNKLVAPLTSLISPQEMSRWLSPTVHLSCTLEGNPSSEDSILKVELLVHASILHHTPLLWRQRYPRSQSLSSCLQQTLEQLFSHCIQASLFHRITTAYYYSRPEDLKLAFHRTDGPCYLHTPELTLEWSLCTRHIVLAKFRDYPYHSLTTQAGPLTTYETPSQMCARISSLAQQLQNLLAQRRAASLMC